MCTVYSRIVYRLVFQGNSEQQGNVYNELIIFSVCIM